MTGRRAKALARNESGATLVEFGLILLPLCVLLMGFLDLGYQSYVRSTLQGTLNDVARAASVEDPDLRASGDSIEEQIENAIIERMATLASGASYEVETSNYFRFSGVGRPERLTKDVNKNGRYDDGDCWLDTNPNEEFDEDGGRDGIGGADDVVFYTVTLTMPRLLPMAGLVGVAPDYSITVRTAMKSQPYANQAAPSEAC
ncbi:TadE/TadG family type IV pilus assembly protein [Sphingosinicella sp. CPCC 101087]|uniref:TadE/TadG family type IV pilus assembly protein n=1 Tax=Sphingosinicella sp. CPCC 101087 TaxID=2497754 RepID=UPI001FB0C8E8|nr:TadE/TadG family type IV pilus assembly protein [Sphingosinicella sp. CPCC 101087]